MEKVSHVTWRTDVAVRELDAYLIALLTRLNISGGKTSSHRHSYGPTVLSDKLADKIVGAFTYIKSSAKKRGLTTIKQVDDMLSTWRDTNRDGDPDEWVEKHQDEVARARRILGHLIGRFTCYG